MKTLLLFLLASLGTTFGQITNLQFAWNPSANAEVYRFWDGNKAVLLGTTSTTNFTVTNWNTALPRTISVTASNEIGESTATVKDVKAGTSTPVNLRTVPLSLVTPVPGVIEISQNLVDWSQRIRLATGTGPTNVQLTWVQYPTDPVMFLRSKAQLSATSPPVP